jgi:hypothetical protein
MKKLFLIFILGVFINSCTVQKPILVDNFEGFIQDYSQIGILPFRVTFSEEYKRLPSRSRNSDWEDQERLAGLDLQKICFTAFSERENSKNWEITPQNYLISNKILAENRVAIADIYLADKAALAKLLKVDAILYGTSEMEFNQQSYRKGMSTELTLVDSKTGQILWKQTFFESLNNSIESPQDLAQKSVNALVKSLPFKVSSN